MSVLSVNILHKAKAARDKWLMYPVCNLWEKCVMEVNFPCVYATNKTCFFFFFLNQSNESNVKSVS